jgi:hypothetical protein
MHFNLDISDGDDGRSTQRPRPPQVQKTPQTTETEFAKKKAIFGLTTRSCCSSESETNEFGNRIGGFPNVQARTPQLIESMDHSRVLKAWECTIRYLCRGKDIECSTRQKKMNSSLHSFIEETMSSIEQTP